LSEGKDVSVVLARGVGARSAALHDPVLYRFIPFSSASKIRLEQAFSRKVTWMIERFA
jgi:hypothetical protein